MDAGIIIKSSEEVMPTEDRITGKHIKDSKIAELFEKTKQNILAGKKVRDAKNVKRKK